MALHHNPRIVTSGLVLALDAADVNSYPGSGTTWKDLSGNGLDMTMTGTITHSTAGPSYFDMSSDSDGYFAPNTSNFNSIANLTTELTFISWVKFTGISQSWQNLFGGMLNGQSASHQISLGRWSADDKYWFEVTTTTANSYLNTPTVDSVPINQWVQMAMTCNTSAGRLTPYINGSSSGLNSSPNGTLSGTFIDYASTYPRVGDIGGTHGPSEYYSTAVYVYNRELTASEIEQNYEAQKTRFGL